MQIDVMTMTENQSFFSKRLNDLKSGTTKLISHDEMWEKIEHKLTALSTLGSFSLGGKDFSELKSDSKNGLLSVVKLSIPYTGEVLNLGVILQDALTHEIRIKLIEDFEKLAKYFQIPDIENIRYAIEMFQKRQISRDTIYSGELSPSLIVTEPSKYIFTAPSLEEELVNAFFAKVSLAKELLRSSGYEPDEQKIKAINE